MIRFFNPEQEKRIIEAIQAAEKNTSGEIRVHLEDKCRKPLMEAATQTFHKLKMDRTAARNGVLVFLVPERKEFAILGDQGINEVVPDGFWEDVRDLMSHHFKNDDFTTGVVQGIARVGEKLKTYFPYQSDDINELPDEISY